MQQNIRRNGRQNRKRKYEGETRDTISIDREREFL
jgi:hypothetical protein